jgi:hypothetical protein
VEVRAPVVVGVYPMRIARYVMDNGSPSPTNGSPANGIPPEATRPLSPGAAPADRPSQAGGNGAWRPGPRRQA